MAPFRLEPQLIPYQVTGVVTFARITVTLALGLSSAGCGGPGSERAPLMGDTDGSAAIVPSDLGPATSSGPCRDGDLKKCTVHAPAHLEINSCVVGVTVCTLGEWGPCQRADRVDGGAEVLAAADAGSE